MWLVVDMSLWSSSSHRGECTEMVHRGHTTFKLFTDTIITPKKNTINYHTVLRARFRIALLVFHN